MIRLIPEIPTARITQSGLHYVQVELNGGSADLQVRFPSGISYVDFEQGSLVDGFTTMLLPRSDIKMVNIIGNPIVLIMKDTETFKFNSLLYWNDSNVWDDNSIWSDYAD